MKHLICVIAAILPLAMPAIAQRPSSHTAVGQLEKNIPALMRVNYIPGLSVAYIRNGQSVWTHNFGVANAETGTKVNDSTRFEAASLSKVVTAYAALRLVDQGLLNLDVPLNGYLGNNYEIGNDPRVDKVTARRVLTHSAGFPNWRNRGDSLLPIRFEPGERFSYSGEGFVYLAKVMEKLTGKSFEQIVRDEVFAPLGMRHSSMVFDSTRRALYAPRHNWLGQPGQVADYRHANAAASLRTTAADYGAFLAAVLNGKGLQPSLRQQMLAPQIKVDTAKTPHLAWGLGIGLEVDPAGRYCWHWGDQGDAKALFAANIDTRDAVVYFTNSANGLAIADDMMELAFGKGQHDILAFVKYGEFEPAAANLVKAVQQQGAKAALAAYKRQRTQPLSEDMLNNIGYHFLREKKLPEAIAVFTQNTEDYPQSGNVWDSLAEAYMNSGDNAAAIRYYEKSLALDPKNDNAAGYLKKLKQPSPVNQ
jgi:CubicO group peptidase (beta-lactamase class C family)